MREAFLTGNIGKQPEMFTPEGSEWTCLTFSIANNEETLKDIISEATGSLTEGKISVNS